MRALALSLVAVLLTSLAGCASNLSGFGMADAPSFDRYQQDTAQNVRHGIVLQVREVEINAPAGSSLQGVIEGAPVSYLVSLLFRNRGVGAQIGAGLATAWGTAALGRVASASRGVQAIVRLDSGNVVSVAQPMEQGNPIYPGEKVLLVGSGRLVQSSY
ncbi:MAG: hypothetical protein EPN77_19400 [Candidimonas sp.]|nr:MAG: hypothetical protein EPN77_19400 [Candidimonas sp.]